MKFYPEDYEVTVEVGFTDLNGNAIEPSAISAKLTDEDDVEIADFPTVLFALEDGKATIVIPRSLNILPEGKLSGARVLRVALDTPAGVVRQSFSYVIEGEFRLELLQNTFLSFEAAELMARNQVNLSGWNVADDERRKAALIEAFGRIIQIPMQFAQRDESSGRLRVEDATTIYRDQWPDVTVEDFMAWPQHFRDALRKAQFAEANELLQGDTLARKHRAGIITETIGESSVTLRAGKIDYGVGQNALAHLAGYIHFNVRIARS